MKRAISLALFLLAAVWTVAVAQGPQVEESRSFFGATVTDKPISPDGTVVLLDLPSSLHTKNVGGSDGAGLCVFTSIQHSACWQNVPQLWDFQKWMTRHPGGGYPEKVDKKIEEICREKRIPKPRYMQIQSGDLEILKLAIRTGRMPAVTYSYSPSGRYGGSKIAHMVTLLHLDEKWACILDNNFPNSFEWCTPAEFQRSYTGGEKNGWTVLLLNPGPPPPPRN